MSSVGPMSMTIMIPGRHGLSLEHLLLDVNGTLTSRGDLIKGVRPRLDALRAAVDVRLLSADTFGTLGAIAHEMGDLPVERVSDGLEKAAITDRLGSDACAAIGNGANDEMMLRQAALGLAVVGPEGAASQTVVAADVVVGSVSDALDILLEPDVLAATLRP
jgi:soluble P-type ATPase